MTDMAAVDEGVRDQVRDRYAGAALTVTEVGATADCCGGGCGPTVLDEAGEAFGAGLYEPDQTLPAWRLRRRHPLL